MNLPGLDHAPHHSQKWITPKLRLNSTEQGIPRLGRDNMKLHSTKEGFPPRSHLHPQLIDSHSPHACSTPGVYTFTVTQSIDCYTSHSRASTTGWIRNSQSSIVSTRLPPGELTSLAHSLTWRESFSQA
jgi:hypothetical protein